MRGNYVTGFRVSASPFYSFGAGGYDVTTCKGSQCSSDPSCSQSAFNVFGVRGVLMELTKNGSLSQLKPLTLE